MSYSSSSGEESDTAVHDFDLEDRSSTPAVEVTNRGERDERDERDEDDHDDHDDESNPALRRLRAHQRRWHRIKHNFRDLARRRPRRARRAATADGRASQQRVCAARPATLCSKAHHGSARKRRRRC